MTDTTSTQNLNDLAEMFEYDFYFIGNIVKAYADNITNTIKSDEFQPDAESLTELRDQVWEVTKFVAEIGEIGLNLRNDFDKFLKVMYEIDVVTKDEVSLVHVAKPRGTAGRRPMTKDERIAAAKKRFAASQD